MTTSSIRRQMKNIVNNYSEAEIKVREATSNDPWGPSSSLMTEIADLTYNVVAFSEIMSMIWKRLNDHGKNWRHVYKALTLLDYLIKTGSERVAQQCKENIFAIQTLKDFQYIDRDGKDQGINVREKSKQLVSLLKDEERLKHERAQALKTKERMAQVATGVGSNNQITFGRGSSQPNLSTSYSEHEYGKSGGSPASYHGSTSPRVSSELEQARPQTSGEEELQLQLALAMSREVAEQGFLFQEERLRRGDDLRLQMALEESRKDTVKIPKKRKEQTALLDLMDALPTSAPALQKSEPWGPSPSTNSNARDPWEGAAVTPTASDPWQSFGSTSFDPFSNLNGTVKDDFSDFDSLRTSSKMSESAALSQHSGTTSPDLFDSQPVNLASSKQTSARKTPESFLGPNAALVNLDSLVTKPAQPTPSLNPFLVPGASSAPPPVNPFQVNQPQPLTLNQLRSSPMMGMSSAFNTVPTMSIESMPLPSVAPAEVGLVQVPTIGGVAPVVRMGPGMNMSMMGSVSQPLRSVSVPPASAHSLNTTNPFLL
ncbi:epsin-2 isoform X5 [Rhinatrema bivittatum]|uniref:epsin-2 isoform X5 n=1 Tax=Rhinatrema bivittatum TaxID=194408 RepID=UPI001126248F|nr:epsin-2 isoform X5 [Rhinatrema bivittatum]